MSIIASAVIADHPQAGGRRRVTEAHTDHLGGVHRVEYVAQAKVDVQAAMAARAPLIEAELAAAEIGANLERSAGDWSFRHCNRAQVAAAIREKFKTAAGIDALLLAERIAPLTDAQLKAAFGLNDAGVTALRAKLTNQVAKLDAARAETGA